MNILCLSLETIEYYLFEELAQREYCIFIGISPEDFIPQSIRHCQFVKIPSFHSKFSWKAIKSLRHIVKEKHIDCIYSTTSAALSNALFATLGTSVKNIGYRGTQAKVRRTDPTYYLAILNPRVTHVVCETKDIVEYLTRFLPSRKLSLNTKPFDIQWVETALRSPLEVEDIPPHALKLIYIANTQGRPHKGLAVLMQAMFLLNDNNIHLTFIGNYDTDIYQSVQKSNIKDQIHFLGKRKDAIHFLPKQDIFILPSTRDASPRTVREAMACGLPCIVSDIPGARDLIIHNQTGILVDPGNAEALTKAIRYLQKEERIRLAFGKASKKRILEDFSVNDYINKFDLLFKNINK